jgi:hypothetical protein
MLVDKMTHERNCRAGPVVWTTVNPHKPRMPAKRVPVTHKAITHTSVTHAVTHTERSKGAERQARYRAKHGATYREKHRNLMRRRRAAGKARAA